MFQFNKPKFKKIMSIVLCLVIVLCYVPVTAFAEGACETHTWDSATGQCTVCETYCTHPAYYTAGYCKTCKMDCPHNFVVGSSKCTICKGKCGTVANHTFNKSAKDAVCIYCGGDCLHTTIVTDACDACGLNGGTNGTYITWVFNEKTGALSIQTTGGTTRRSMTEHAQTSTIPWYSLKDKVTSVVISKYITNLTPYAFKDFTSLETVTLGYYTTTVGKEAFSGCTSLKSVELGAGTSSYKKAISEKAFSGCTALSSITFPYYVSAIGANAFEGCTALKTVTFEAYSSSQMSSAQIDATAFSSCTNLNEVVYREGNAYFQNNDIKTLFPNVLKYFVHFDDPDYTSWDWHAYTSGKITRPEDQSNATQTMAGNTFDGWYKNDTYTASWNFSSDTVTADMTLYGQYIPVAVKVVQGSTTYQYNSIQEAIDSQYNHNGKTILVNREHTLEETIKFNRDWTLTLDLNGNTVTGVSGQNAIEIGACKKLTITDKSEDADGTVAAANGAALKITQDATKVVLSGGTYVGSPAIEIDNSTLNYANILASGYCYYDVDGKMLNPAKVASATYLRVAEITPITIGDFTISSTDGKTVLIEDVDYSYSTSKSGNQLTVKTTIPVTIGMREGVTTTEEVIIINTTSGDAIVTLDTISINTSKVSLGAVVVNGDNDCTITAKGTSTIHTSYSSGSAIQLSMKSKADITINGTGTLNLSNEGTGGNGVIYAATYGNGSLTIEGEVTVNAEASDEDASGIERFGLTTVQGKAVVKLIPGSDAYGIYSRNSCRGIVIGGSAKVTVEGGYSGLGCRTSVDNQVTIKENASVTINDAGTYGIKGYGPVTIQDNAVVNITLSGTSAHGIYADRSGQNLTITDQAQVTIANSTTGSFSRGLRANGSVIINGSASVNITGGTNQGITADGGVTIGGTAQITLKGMKYGMSGGVTIGEMAEVTISETTDRAILNNYAISPISGKAYKVDAGVDVNSAVTTYYVKETTGLKDAESTYFHAKITDSVPVTITGTDKEITYQGDTYDVSQMFAIDDNAGKESYEIVEGTDAGTLDGSKLTITKAGTIKIKITTIANGIYSAGEATATLTINKGVGKGKVTISDWTYGDSAKEAVVTSETNGIENVTYTYVGVDDTDYAESVIVPTQAGNYKVIAKFAETDLYNTFETEDIFSIEKRKVTATVTVKNKEYDGNDEATIENIIINNMIDGDDVTIREGTATFNSKNVAEATTVSFTGWKLSGADEVNYELIEQPTDASAKITAKEVVVTPKEGQSRVYGKDDPSFIYDVTLIGEDTLTGKLGREDGTSVGKYNFTLGTLENSNYTLKLDENAPQFEITQAALKITAENKNVVENTSLPEFTYQVEGLVGKDKLTVEPTFSTDADLSKIGEYVIIVSKADAGNNYSIEYVSGKLTVLADDAVKAAEDFSKKLDEFDSQTVTSADKEKIQTIIDQIDTWLKTENITDNGKKALNDVRKDAETLIKAIEAMNNATVSSGDNNSFWMLFGVMFVSGMSIVGMTVYEKKRRF